MRLSIRRIMVGIAVTGILLGLIRSGALGVMFLSVGALALVADPFRGLALFRTLPLRWRLVLEVFALGVLLAISAGVWGPEFYRDEARRCEDLAWLASSRPGDDPAVRAALERESAWCSRQAGRLRRKGWWVGLSGWPFAWGQDDSWDGERFVIEARIDRHERAVADLRAAP